MKKFIFIGQNENFEDTLIQLIDAYDKDDAYKLLKLFYFNMTDQDELNSLTEIDENNFNVFMKENTYILKDIKEIQSINIADYIIEKKIIFK